MPSSSAVAAEPPRAVVRRRLDPFELAVLGALALLSLWVVVTDLVQASRHGLVWTGTDGFFIVDQMQYLSWIQSVAHHGLISNLYVLRDTPADYLQPAITVSAALVRLGMASWLALLLWKPVAVLGFFLAARAVVHRTFTRTIDRRVALVLAVLFGSLSAVYGSLGVVGDMMPVWLTWGYPFGLIAVALIVFALLSYDRARATPRMAWAPGLLGALASSLHPWQGELLILVLAGAELARLPETVSRIRAAASGRLVAGAARDARVRLALLTIGLTLVPLVYYMLLGRFDVNWEMARNASKHAFSFSAIAIAAAPLAVFAALGYRGRAGGFLGLTMRLWPVAALVIYVLSATALSATPLHAFNGITIPLAILAVRGVRESGLARIPRGRALVAVAVLLGTVPANVYAMAYAHTYTAPQFNNANYVRRDELRAVDYLAKVRDPGGVLAQFYLGDTVPGRTGRRAFVGDCLWSQPRCIPRSLQADAFFQGRMSRAAAGRFARETGARFVLASCQPHVDIARLLGSMVVAARRFGCAEVWELQPPSTPTGPYAGRSERRRA